MSINIHKANIEQILKRVGEIIHSDQNLQIAAALHVSATTSSNWKTRKSIPWEGLFSFSQERKISMDWILTGETPGRCSVGCDKKMSELCKKVKRILDSKTAFGNALEANIHAFDESVTLKREVENLKEVMSKGRLSGTSEKPARRAGQKRRAG